MSNLFADLEGYFRGIVPARDGRVLPEDILAAADDSTRVIALSYVQWTAGFRMDLETIGQFCRRACIWATASETGS